MTRLNVQVKDVAGSDAISTKVFKTEAAATAIKLGEPVKLKAAGSVYVIPLADAEPVVGTTTSVCGIAAGDSNHTAAADGLLEVYIPKPGIIYRAKAKTASDIDSQAKLDGKTNDRVIFDLTSSVYTVDTGAADGATNGLVIVGGNVTDGTVDFMIRVDGTYLGG